VKKKEIVNKGRGEVEEEEKEEKEKVDKKEEVNGQSG
jgi:hypothetical protein